MTTTLSSLPLPPSIQLKLAAAGFTSVGDFDGLSATELAEDLAVEPREAQKLLAQVRSCLEVQPRDLKTKSALQLLNEERASNPITTFVKDLDNDILRIQPQISPVRVGARTSLLRTIGKVRTTP